MFHNMTQTGKKRTVHAQLQMEVILVSLTSQLTLFIIFLLISEKDGYSCQSIIR